MSISMADLDPIEQPAPDNPFRIGDTAYAKFRDLDGRGVVAVAGMGIRIQIGTIASDWLDATAYDKGDR